MLNRNFYGSRKITTALWIFFTIFATMVQTIKTSLQKSLSLKLDSEPVT